MFHEEKNVCFECACMAGKEYFFPFLYLIQLNMYCTYCTKREILPDITAVL